MSIFSCGYLLIILSVFSFIGSILNMLTGPAGLLLALPLTWFILKYPVRNALDRGGKIAVWTVIALIATVPVNLAFYAWTVMQEGMEARGKRSARHAAELRTKRLRIQRENLIHSTKENTSSTL